VQGDLPPGVRLQPADDLAAALQRCPLVVTATPAAAPCLEGPLRPDTFVAAIGAFTPAMIELAPPLTRQLAATGRLVIDSPAARHEAGDLLGAGLNTAGLATLGDVLAGPTTPRGGAVLFKSCGAALWDLAAARCAVAALKPR
jgi:1-piperideine-2-carboxylate/1-pyrroline-2-carboxylate reductase [NAD(P)H]